ncbi:hypothetical protein HPB48_023610 [Haemaphysalis longicornis]|uniref:Transposable element P transposase n=1 Tax=Haemaphysalis longicornis TaxID=44386 RepID=A0A9J6H8C1_HAELO|nr:hypothetical protein HPB48_023610 [Haemaphysalis longicornis]
MLTVAPRVGTPKRGFRALRRERSDTLRDSKRGATLSFPSVDSRQLGARRTSLTAPRAQGERSPFVAPLRMHGRRALTTIDGIGAIPHKVNDIRCLTRLLDSVESLRGKLSCKHEDKIEGLLKLAFSLLEDASNCELADVERLNAIRFLKEQVSLLLVRHSKQSRYSPEFLVFSSILFTISPHAYRFLRSTGNVRLPHPSTIRRVCNSYNVSPAAEQQGASFLSYAKKLVTTMKEHEKIVVLMMDEIHLQPYFDYKGGTIVGAASNSPKQQKQRMFFMMQSLLSSQKNVVHILPVERINAEELHTLLRSIITQLENVGLRIIAVITDNNSINRKTMSLFGAPCKLQSVYPHPADPDRPLLFLIDPVHLMKCVEEQLAQSAKLWNMHVLS